MRASEDRATAALVTLVAAIVASTLVAGCGGREKKETALTPEQLVARGRSIFNTTCATCHGSTLKGTSMAPSMIQPAFAPDQTPDQAFFNAIRNGVPQKRFQKGPMPAQPSVATRDIPAVVAYVRFVQAQNGVTAGGTATSAPSTTAGPSTNSSSASSSP